MILSFSKIKHYSPWILAALLYAPVFYDLYYSRWKSSDYTHAYFILPVFLWLVWRKRGVLRDHLQKINPPLVPPFARGDTDQLANVSSAPGADPLNPTFAREKGSVINYPPLVPPFARGDTGGCGNTFQPCPHETRPRGNGEREDGEKKFLQSNTISNFVGLFMLVFGASMFIFGWRGNSLFIATLSLLPVLYGLISCLYGLKLTKVLFFPILYLILLAPPSTSIVDSITLPMRYGVSVVTETILKLFHYPITREGLLLSIGNNELFIGQPCSGFRSLITMFSAGLVYVFLSKANFSKRVILTSSIIPLALLGNLFRIIILCLITYYFGEAAGQGFFHNFSGIIMVVIITLGLIGLEYLLGKHIPNTSYLPLSLPHGGGQGEEMSPAGGGAGGGNIPRPWKGYRNKKVYITNTVLLLTIIFCYGIPKAKTKYTGMDILSQLKIPHEISGWQGKDVGQEWNIEDEKYFYISQVLEREYVNGDKNLFLVILDAENSHNPKICSENAGFKSTELNAADIHTSNRKFKAQCLYTEKDGDGYLLISWVCVNKQIVDWVGQRLKLVWFSLFDQKGSNLMIRLDIPCKEDGIKDALEIAKEFISDFGQTVSIETADYIFGES